ncbi:MAG: helix-turn-helix domain-containing protein [Candidatus Woesearchaeota archaeon]
MKLEILEEVGLSQTEAKVYLALLEIGSGLAGDITKKADINRTNVYDALERLIKKGLVTYVISANRKIFEPVAPERLKELLQEKEERISSILPDLNILFKESKHQEEAMLFKGKKGVKSAYEAILKEKREVFVYGAESRFADMFPAYQKEWNERRAKLKLHLNIIFNEKVRERKIKENLKLCKMRFLPQSYEFPSTILFSGNVALTIVWTETPFAFLIRSKEAVKSNLNFFDILWKVAKD